MWSSWSCQGSVVARGHEENNTPDDHGVPERAFLLRNV
jgi:hypothetical protein